MILTTTLIICLLVGLFGLLNTMNIRTIYENNRQQVEQIFIEQMTGYAKNKGETLAYSARESLLETKIDQLNELITNIVKGDPEIDYGLIADDQKRIWAHSMPSLQDKAREGKMILEVEENKKGSSRFVDKDDGRILEVTQPITDQSGHLRGWVQLGFKLEKLNRRLDTAKEEEKKQFSASMSKTFFLGVVSVLLGILISILQGFGITKPIKDLAKSAEKIAHGDLTSKAKVGSNDEIGVLSQNFNYMAERIGYLLEDTAKKAVFEKEMEIASAIQETLIPPVGLIEREHFKFSGYFKSASICGGDWWNFQDLTDGRLLVIIGDVTGHGVPSAMLTATAKSCVDTIRNLMKANYTVTFLLTELNRIIFETGKGKFFMTAFASIIDPKAKVLRYANAGHNFPYLLRKNGASYETHSLVVRGNRLGDLYHSQFEEKQIPLEQGDVVVWYTDGMVECDNEDGIVYGEKRFRRAVSKAIQHSPEIAIERILEDFNRFREGNPLIDDITMIVGKVC
jgi:serine phosphatase RsbU (regulator of sigma subunit)